MQQRRTRTYTPRHTHARAYCRCTFEYPSDGGAAHADSAPFDSDADRFLTFYDVVYAKMRFARHIYLSSLCLSASLSVCLSAKIHAQLFERVRLLWYLILRLWITISAFLAYMHDDVMMRLTHAWWRDDAPDTCMMTWRCAWHMHDDVTMRLTHAWWRDDAPDTCMMTWWCAWHMHDCVSTHLISFVSFEQFFMSYSGSVHACTQMLLACWHALTCC